MTDFMNVSHTQHCENTDHCFSLVTSDQTAQSTFSTFASCWGPWLHVTSCHSLPSLPVIARLCAINKSTKCHKERVKASRSPRSVCLPSRPLIMPVKTVHEQTPQSRYPIRLSDSHSRVSLYPTNGSGESGPTPSLHLFHHKMTLLSISLLAPDFDSAINQQNKQMRRRKRKGAHGEGGVHTKG